MNQWSIFHGQRGFGIALDEVPWWARAVECGYEGLLGLLGEPCCHSYKSGRRTIWGLWTDYLVPSWPRWTKRDGDAGWETNPREQIQVWQFHLINNRLAHFAHTHTKRVLSLPLSDDEAMKVDAEFAVDMNEIFPPSERPRRLLSYSCPHMSITAGLGGSAAPMCTACGYPMEPSFQEPA